MKIKRTVNKSLGAYIGSTVDDSSIKTNSLFPTGKRNPRKKISSQEFKKRKAKRKANGRKNGK